MVYTLDEIVEQLEWCDYENEAGKLKCNDHWFYFKNMIKRIKRDIEYYQNNSIDVRDDERLNTLCIVINGYDEELVK